MYIVTEGLNKQKNYIEHRFIRNEVPKLYLARVVVLFFSRYNGCLDSRKSTEINSIFTLNIGKTGFLDFFKNQSLDGVYRMPSSRCLEKIRIYIYIFKKPKKPVSCRSDILKLVLNYSVCNKLRLPCVMYRLANKPQPRYSFFPRLFQTEV
jgi:hypothetical protein